MTHDYSRAVINTVIFAIGLSFMALFFRYLVFGNYAIELDPTIVTNGQSSRALIASDALACEWDQAPFLFFSGNVFSPLIYYSHLFPAIATGILMFLIWRERKRGLLNQLFVLLSGIFIAWSLFDLVLWATEKPEFVMFFWSGLIYLDVLIYMCAAYLFYVFVNKKDVPFIAKLIGSGLLLPVIILAPTSLNLSVFDYTNCDREAVEGLLWHYVYIVEFVLTLWLVVYAMRAVRTLKSLAERIQTGLLALGLCLFLLAFSWGNIIGTLSEDWAIAQYGLFGMPVFLATVMYLIVRFQAFQVRVIAAGALVTSLFVLLFSVLFLEDMATAKPVIGITLFFFALMGFLLVRSVQKEIAQRELIEKQEKELEVVNAQQENLLHFISHEVKGYLTKSEAGFAAITEGDYGAIPDTLKGMATSALADVRKGVRTVMQILNASNLKKGTMGYKMQTFDFKKAVMDTVKHLKPAADEKHIGIETAIAWEGNYMLNGDEEKIRQHVLRNLIDNAIKYTPSGSIKVELARQGNTIRFSVQDSGVGITPEDMKQLFTEGGHGKESIKVNVHSTGYGLFIAKQIVEAHGGKIWAESEGGGKGARFVVELPAA